MEKFPGFMHLHVCPMWRLSTAICYYGNLSSCTKTAVIKALKSYADTLAFFHVCATNNKNMLNWKSQYIQPEKQLQKSIRAISYPFNLVNVIHLLRHSSENLSETTQAIFFWEHHVVSLITKMPTEAWRTKHGHSASHGIVSEGWPWGHYPAPNRWNVLSSEIYLWPLADKDGPDGSNMHVSGAPAIPLQPQSLSLFSLRAWRRFNWLPNYVQCDV